MHVVFTYTSKYMCVRALAQHITGTIVYHPCVSHISLFPRPIATCRGFQPSYHTNTKAYLPCMPCIKCQFSRPTDHGHNNKNPCNACRMCVCLLSQSQHIEVFSDKSDSPAQKFNKDIFYMWLTFSMPMRYICHCTGMCLRSRPNRSQAQSSPCVHVVCMCVHLLVLWATDRGFQRPKRSTRTFLFTVYQVYNMCPFER